MTLVKTNLKISVSLEIKYQMIVRAYLYLLFFFLIGGSLYAQTCCSGGVPVASNLGLPPSEAGAIQLSLGYDLNVLETLKTGRETLEDDSRSRKTHTGILEAGYSFSNKFSIDAFFSFVRQEREISQFNNTNFSATEGIGDAVLLFKYKVFNTDDNHTIFQLGAGPKLPLGASDKRNEQGLTLNADLQPGSGAWDIITWGQLAQVLPFRPSMSLNLTAIFSTKGTNDNYLGSQAYQFGNELQLALGISERMVIGNSLFDPAITIRYRKQAADVLNEFAVPSTGGNWWFINPSISYWVTPDISFEAALTIPIQSNITGTQVTPTYRLRTGVFYRIPSKKSTTIDIPIFKS